MPRGAASRITVATTWNHRGAPSLHTQPLTDCNFHNGGSELLRVGSAVAGDAGRRGGAAMQSAAGRARLLPGTRGAAAAADTRQQGRRAGGVGAASRGGLSL